MRALTQSSQIEKVRKVTNEFNQVFVCDIGSRQMINMVFILFATYFFVCFSSNSFTAKVPCSARYFHQCLSLMKLEKQSLLRSGRKPRER